MLLDCHTHHHAPQPQAIVNASPVGFMPIENQIYSLGIHPWNPEEATEENFEALLRLGALPEVVAIGEAGVDTAKGGPVYKQILSFKRQIQISEQLGKPLIVHDVKAHDIIIGLRRDYAPKQPWIIHGFRAKPSVVDMLLRASDSFYFSFGQHFNADSLSAVPDDHLLAETDESSLSIEEIILNLSDALGRDITDRIACNTEKILGVKALGF